MIFSRHLDLSVQDSDASTESEFESFALVPCCKFLLALCEKVVVFLQQEAIETFKEALKLKSDFIDAYKSLGQAYRYGTDTLRSLSCLLHICFSSMPKFVTAFIFKGSVSYLSSLPYKQW